MVSHEAVEFKVGDSVDQDRLLFSHVFCNLDSRGRQRLELSSVYHRLIQHAHAAWVGPGACIHCMFLWVQQQLRVVELFPHGRHILHRAFLFLSPC